MLLYQTLVAEIAIYLQRCPARTSVNEDSAGIFNWAPGCHALAVADGMGGMPGATDASRIAMQSIDLSVETSSEEQKSSREFLVDAIDIANKDIQNLGVGAGTTLAIAAITDNTLRTFHVGDSEVLVVGQRGKIKLRTIPHTPTGYAQEAGVLVRCVAFSECLGI